MSFRTSLSVSVSPELKAFFAGRLASGRCANASEVVRAARRLMERRELDLGDARKRLTESDAAGR